VKQLFPSEQLRSKFLQTQNLSKLVFKKINYMAHLKSCLKTVFLRGLLITQ